jgi:DNA-binding CsgD family transcriptional regulator
MEAAVLGRALDRLTLAVMMIDGEQTLLWANAAARALLAEAEGFRLHRGRLLLAFREDASRLRDALRRGGSLPIHRGGERAPLAAHVVPEPAAPRAGGTLFLADPERSGQCAPGELEALYGLTPAEARTVRCVARGASVARSAEILGVTHHTVRFNLKRAFAKTGARSQAQLVRLVVSGAGATRSDSRTTGDAHPADG